MRGSTVGARAAGALGRSGGRRKVAVFGKIIDIQPSCLESIYQALLVADNSGLLARELIDELGEESGALLEYRVHDSHNILDEFVESGKRLFEFLEVLLQGAVRRCDIHGSDGAQ